VEAVFCTIALYYFNRLKPKFDKNIQLMTLSITIAFIVRSSSLIGWIPLALVKLLSDPFGYFLPILLAGLLVAVPTCVFSIGLDSLFYGRLTVPQFNFVYYNVVENLSTFFGVSPTHYYVEELPNFISNLDGIHFALLGMCLLTIY
jgi:phosphatidylinositol glycan class B